MNPSHPTAVRIVQAFRSGSSLPMAMVADDGRTYVVKLRGSGDGVLSLLVEFLTTRIALLAGLPSLEPGTILLNRNIDASVCNDEEQDLLARSHGINLTFPYLAGSVPVTTDEIVDPALRMQIFLFDCMTLMFDRTVRNSNILRDGDRFVCIDFASSLFVRGALTGAQSIPQRVWAELRRHPFYPPRIDLDDLPAVTEASREDCRRWIQEIPPDWYAGLVLDKGMEGFLTGLHSTLADPGRFHEILARVAATPYESDAFRRELQAQQKRAFEEKHGRF